MPYTTYNELIVRYPQFNKVHEGNEALINSYFIAPAEAELNSRLAAAYSVPFSTVYPVIKDLTWDLCYAKMMMSQNPKDYKEFYDGVIERINRLVNGDDAIFSDDGTKIEADSTASDIWSNTMEYHPVHSMLGAESPYTRVSSEQLYDAEQDRS